MWWTLLGVIAVFVFPLVFLWVVIGGISPPAGSSGTDLGATQGGNPFAGCQGCIVLEDWWSSLTSWQKARELAWYQARRLHCRDCPKDPA